MAGRRSNVALAQENMRLRGQILAMERTLRIMRTELERVLRLLSTEGCDQMCPVLEDRLANRNNQKRGV